MMINDLVRSYGLEISPSKKPGTICAVGALEYIYDKYEGGAVLVEIQIVSIALSKNPGL